jgi:hypothetical protein
MNNTSEPTETPAGMVSLGDIVYNREDSEGPVIITALGSSVNTRRIVFGDGLWREYDYDDLLKVKRPTDDPASQLEAVEIAIENQTRAMAAVGQTIRQKTQGGGAELKEFKDAAAEAVTLGEITALGKLYSAALTEAYGRSILERINDVIDDQPESGNTLEVNLTAFAEDVQLSAEIFGRGVVADDVGQLTASAEARAYIRLAQRDGRCGRMLKLIKKRRTLLLE